MLNKTGIREKKDLGKGISITRKCKDFLIVTGEYLMSNVFELPIYKSSYELLVETHKITQNFPRNFKNGIAATLCSSSQNILTNILKVNTTHDKEQKMILIEKIREENHLVQLLYRVSKELKLVSPAQHGRITLLTTSVGKQNQGWLNYFRKSAS